MPLSLTSTWSSSSSSESSSSASFSQLMKGAAFSWISVEIFLSTYFFDTFLNKTINIFCVIFFPSKIFHYLNFLDFKCVHFKFKQTFLSQSSNTSSSTISRSYNAFRICGTFGRSSSLCTFPTNCSIPPNRYFCALVFSWQNCEQSSHIKQKLNHKMSYKNISNNQR